ncbi:ABC transporter permease [Rugamonas sp. A1-17]|nr:ABC transporter permease [Rugamonas sp. A1-17]
MLSPRWRKLLRDVALTPGRVALMVLAMAAGVCALATMLSSYTILSRETTRNYLDTNPPSATLQLERIDAPLLAAIRAFPGIAQAQASGTVGVTLAAQGQAEALPLTIFMVDDFNALHINTVYREQGAWPPPDGSLLLERDALRLIGQRIGQRIAISTGHGAPRSLLISGTVHDPALPPASRGQTVYAYATPATVAALGLDGSLRQLKLTVSEQPMNVDAIEATVARLALWLRQNGHAVERIRIPPPGEHPHQKVMTSILAMLLVFSGVALLLSAVLTATVVGGMLQQQRRQIGVMKTIGAGRAQIAGLYLTLVLALAGVATTLGMTAGLAAGRAFSRVVLNQILNFTMHSGAIPHWCYLLLIAAGVLLPLAIAAVPIVQASAATVQAAISDTGTHGQHYAATAPAAWLDRLPLVDRSRLLALRNSLRRRGRLLLTLSLLALAGAMYMSSLNIRAASARHLVVAASERHYDIETTLARPAPVDQVTRLLGALPIVARVEAWERSSVARERADGLGIERVYPDGAHGTLAIQAVPEHNATLSLEMLAGRWLAGGQSGEVVLNSAALEFFPQARVGGSIGIAAHGRTLTLRVAGIARQDMTAATVFVSAPTYARMAGRAGQATSYLVVLRAHDEVAIAQAARDVGRTLAGAGIEVRMNMTETMLRKEVDGHFDLLIAAMLFIALLMAAVGLFGLGSAMGSNVAERGREFGIMRSAGASSAVVLRNVLAEGVLVALMSVPLALALSLPLSAAIGAYLGELLFGLAFPLTVSAAGALAWLVMVLLGALLASGLPAWSASRLSIHQTLASL